MRTQNVTVARIVERINQNAEPVQALTAHPSVTASQSRFGAGLSGKMALERQGNFMMELEKAVTGSPVVNIGSNSREYWFWSKEAQNGDVLVGEYQSGGQVPQELLFQPEWVIEALGLRTISPDEEARIKLEKGSEPGTLVLTHYRDNGEGSSVIKRTVVDERTGRILKHVFYTGDQRRPVAVATVSSPRAIPLKTNSTPGSTQAPAVEIPQRIQLTLSPTENRKEDTQIDIRLERVNLNPGFDSEARQALFTVPSSLGKVVHLENTPAYAAGGDRDRNRAYRSRPSPPPASLGGPEPIGADGESLNWSDPMPLGPDLKGPQPSVGGVSAIVRPGMPVATDGLDMPQPHTVRRASLGTGFDY